MPTLPVWSNLTPLLLWSFNSIQSPSVKLLQDSPSLRCSQASAGLKDIFCNLIANKLLYFEIFL